MRHAIRGIVTGLGIFLFGVGVLRSQALQGQSQGKNGAANNIPAQNTGPVIRTTTRLVQISVVVSDKKGQPVTGLKREDFTVLDGGQPQKIATFSGEEPKTSSQPVRTLPPNIFTNRRDKLGEAPGSNTILLLDALNTQLRDQIYAHDQVLKFLRTIQPQDHFAIYALTGPGRVEIVHEFTQDDAELLKALKQYEVKQADQSIVPFAQSMDFPGLPSPVLSLGSQDSGSSSATGRGSGEAREIMREDFARFRLYPEVAAMIGIANHVAAIPGRKNLIWITGGMRMMNRGQDLPEKVKLADFGYRLGTPEYAERENDLLRAVGESMNAANVVMYGVDVHGTEVEPGFDVARRTGPGVGPGQTSGVPTHSSALRSSQQRLDAEQSLRDTYRRLADETGGGAFYGNNDLREGMSKAFDDGRYAYMIGYYPDHGTWDGKFRKIQIKLAVEGAHARFRDGYYATQEKPELSQDEEKRMQEMASSPLDSTALSMMVSGRHVKTSNPSATRDLEFQVGVDVAQLLLQHAGTHWKGAIDLMFVQKNERLEVIAAEKKHIELDFTDEQYQGMQTTGAIFERHLALMPEAKDVRVLVRDAGSGQIGTVTVPLKTFFPSVAAASAK
jgi:VWFA-related protein